MCVILALKLFLVFHLTANQGQYNYEYLYIRELFIRVFSMFLFHLMEIEDLRSFVVLRVYKNSSSELY